MAPAEANIRRLLIVDDNRDAARALCTMLKLLGNDARAAFDGHQAVEVASQFQPDVILLDLDMPRLSGYEAARAIRRQPWGAKVLLVALTGWGQPQDKERSRTAGFDHHLVKPVELPVLEAILADRNRRRRPGHQDGSEQG